MLPTTLFCFPAHAHAQVRHKSSLLAFSAIMEPPGALVSQPCSSPTTITQVCEYKELGLSKSSQPLISFPENYHLSASWEKSCVDSLEVLLLLWNQDVLVSFPVPVSNYPGKGNFKGKRFTWLTIAGSSPAGKASQGNRTRDSWTQPLSREGRELGYLHASTQLTFPTLT